MLKMLSVPTEVIELHIVKKETVKKLRLTCKYLKYITNNYFFDKMIFIVSKKTIYFEKKIMNR